jgi:hypothetical protein
VPDYDWLTDEDFKSKVVARSQNTAKELGFKADNSVTVFLLFLLDKYHKENEQSEKGKTIWESRSPKDAFASVDTLIKEASRFAKSRNSSIIDLTDITNAHSVKYCTVWPFCGKEKNKGFIFNS